jgi:hypothetical protein
MNCEPAGPDEISQFQSLTSQTAPDPASGQNDGSLGAAAFAIVAAPTFLPSEKKNEEKEERQMRRHGTD